MIFSWETIYSSSCSDVWTVRAKVIGGWIVRHKDATGQDEVAITMVFVPDPEHKWEISK